MTTLVVGATGGVGKAIAGQLAASGERVWATGRRELPDVAGPGVERLLLDAADEEQVAALCRDIDTLDRVIVATGLLHTDAHGPEKSIRQFDPAFFAQNMAANTLPAMLLAKHTQSLLRRSEAPVFAALSARVGSIGDNRLGGWYSYRASKAALNMLIRCLAIEWKRVMPASVVVALHPGTVDTPLSEPFQGNVDPDKLFTPTFSAQRLLTVLDALGPEDSGGQFAWDGTRVPD